MNPAKEAGKLGLFALGVALMTWVSRKLEGTWAGIILLRGDNGGKKK